MKTENIKTALRMRVSYANLTITSAQKRSEKLYNMLKIVNEGEGFIMNIIGTNEGYTYLDIFSDTECTDSDIKYIFGDKGCEFLSVESDSLVEELKKQGNVRYYLVPDIKEAIEQSYNSIIEAFESFDYCEKWDKDLLKKYDGVLEIINEMNSSLQFEASLSENGKHQYSISIVTKEENIPMKLKAALSIAMENYKIVRCTDEYCSDYLYELDSFSFFECFSHIIPCLVRDYMKKEQESSKEDEEIEYDDTFDTSALDRFIELNEAKTAEDGTDYMAQLDKLIGLDEVKTQVKRISALARLKKDMADSGMNALPITLNMVFEGNPGTAKTTVARILAGIFCQLGLLNSREVVEASRAELIGEYTGQTAPKVKMLFERAKGKVLFIDEAYSLVDRWRNGYGDEAISTIIQEMENNREETIVIFAGYPKPMEEFLKVNPGLKSRIPFTVNFKDYSVDEMVKISELEAANRGFKIDNEAKKAIANLTEGIQGNETAGNGRFCRNLVENAIMSYATRLYSDDENTRDRDFKLISEDFESCVLESADIIEKNNEKTASVKRVIGFCPQ